MISSVPGCHARAVRHSSPHKGFLYQVQAMLSSVAPENTSIDTRNWVYSLEVDGSTIDARRWRSLWEAHGDDNPLLAIIASLPPEPIPPRKEPTELITSPSSSSAETPEPRYPSGVSDTLKKLDERMREHRERRSRTIATLQSKHAGDDDADGLGNPFSRRFPSSGGHRMRRYRSAGLGKYDNDHPYQYIDPYYSPPKFVLDAVRNQSKREKEDRESHGLAQGASGAAGVAQTDGPGPGAGSATKSNKKLGQERPLPVFKWYIGKEPSEEASSDPDEAESTRRMKSLLAYIHQHMLFRTDNTKSSSYFPRTTKASEKILNRTYNAIPLKTRSIVESQLLHLRDTYHVNNYILDLLRTFVRGVSDLLDEFIAREYECIVKGKIWAAISAVLETFRFSGRSMTTDSKIDQIAPLAYQTKILEEYHINILAIPLDLVLRHVRSIREGLAGVESRAIPRSMVDAFIQIVVLLVEAASEGERIVAGIERLPEGSGGRTVDFGSLDINDLETLKEGPEGRDWQEEDPGSSDAKNSESLEKSARVLEKSLEDPEWEYDSVEQSARDPKNRLDYTEEGSESLEENLDRLGKVIESPDAKNPDSLEKRPNSLEGSLRRLEKTSGTLLESSRRPETNPEHMKGPSPAASSPGPSTRSSSTDRSTDWLTEWLLHRSRNSLQDNPEDNLVNRSKGSSQDSSGNSSKYTLAGSMMEIIRIGLKYKEKYRAKYRSMYRSRYRSEDSSWSIPRNRSRNSSMYKSGYSPEDYPWSIPRNKARDRSRYRSGYSSENSSWSIPRNRSRNRSMYKSGYSSENSSWSIPRNRPRDRSKDEWSEKSRRIRWTSLSDRSREGSRDRSSNRFQTFQRRPGRRSVSKMRNVGRLGIPSDHYSDSESETDEITITPHLLPYDPSPGIDSLFARLDQARDECCAMFRSNEDEASSAAVSGLGLIVARMLESVLKGHSTCKEMPDLNIGEVYATYTNALVSLTASINQLTLIRPRLFKAWYRLG